MSEQCPRLRGCIVFEVSMVVAPPLWAYVHCTPLTPGGRPVVGTGAIHSDEAAAEIRALLSSYSHAFFAAAEFGVGAMAFPAWLDAWVPQAVPEAPTFRIMLTATAHKSMAQIRSLNPSGKREDEFDATRSYGPDYGGNIVVSPTISKWIDAWANDAWPLLDFADTPEEP